MADPKIISLGSLYFNSIPILPGTKFYGERIGIGNTVPGKEILFVQWKNLYVADRCVCTNIRWWDLDKQGYIFGRPVLINGSPYLCRSLKAGTEKGVPNEWDDLLDSFGESNDLWHWRNRYFWGQDTSRDFAQHRAARGFCTARYWEGYHNAAWRAYLGFRPVLEPLPPMPLVTNAMIGHNIKIYGEDGSIVGCLVGYSDYDLELKVKEPLADGWTWVREAADGVFANRDSIIYIQGDDK